MLDLDRPPYRPARALLAELRAGPERWPELACRMVGSTGRGTHDAHGTQRARVVHLLSLSATPGDLALVRHLMDAEIEARTLDSAQSVGEPLTLLSALLVEYGDARDTLRFWRAKWANFDTAMGYDIEFVFAHLPPPEAVQRLEVDGAERLEALERYDLDAIAADRADWRVRLARRTTRDPAGMEPAECEAWAELFDDHAGVERFGLMGAEGSADRARLHRRLGQHAEALAAWREALPAVTAPWDRTSMLVRALEDAARAGQPALAEAREIERLRPQIESWPDVGLGRMATEACHALAAAIDDPAVGRALWTLAERWRAALTSQSLVGLIEARGAAAKWGSRHARRQLERAVRRERKRIGR